MDKMVSKNDDEKTKRYRVSVPTESAQVIEWINNQSSLSYSFMAVVRDWISKNGTGNVFAQPVEVLPKRGRPTNAMRAAVNNINDSYQSSQSELNSFNKSADNHTDDYVDDNGFFDYEQSSDMNGQSSSIADILNGRNS